MTCQAKVIITVTASVSWMMLATTLASVEVIADCAPMTSLFSLLTSAPVRVRVKKATGIVCTCAYTARRRSAIRPSPMRGREPAGGEPVDRFDDRQRGDPGGQPDHGGGGDRRVPARDDRVHDPTGEDRSDHTDDRTRRR